MAFIIIIIIINDTLARSLEPVFTECKEHTIHTQTQVVASRKPKEIKRTHEGEANLTTQSAQKPHRTTAMLTCHGKKIGAQRPITYHRTAATDDAVVVFFTLTDRASTIPSTIRGCQSGTWSAGQKEIRGTSTKLQ